MLLIALAAAVASPAPINTYDLGGGRGWFEAANQAKCSENLYDCAVHRLRAYDVEGALGLLRQAAHQHDPRALRELGLMNLRGDILKRDDAAAVGWFYEAALVGDRESMRMLAYAFGKGVGVAPDPTLADYWSRRAAATR